MSLAPFSTWLPTADSAAREPVDVFALLAAGAPELHDLDTQLWDRDVDHATLELCRARITTMISGTPIESTHVPETDAQRAAVDFAEQFVLDPHGCTDEQMRGLQTHFTGPQLATLTTAIAVFDALARVRTVLAAPEEGTS